MSKFSVLFDKLKQAARVAKVVLPEVQGAVAIAQAVNSKSKWRYQPRVAAVLTGVQLDLLALRTALGVLK
jgi:hypothetical protein